MSWTTYPALSRMMSPSMAMVQCKVRRNYNLGATVTCARFDDITTVTFVLFYCECIHVLVDEIKYYVRKSGRSTTPSPSSAILILLNPTPIFLPVELDLPATLLVLISMSSEGTYPALESRLYTRHSKHATNCA